MSNDGGIKVWVGDLDGQIDIDQINRWNDAEAEDLALHIELSTLGGLPLLDGRSTSTSALKAKGLKPDEWRWAVHQAEKLLRYTGEDPLFDLERALVRGLLCLGRPYAIGRYARWERLPLATARTAVLPFGHLALIDRHLAEAGSIDTPALRRAFRDVTNGAGAAEGLVAYERTAIVRAGILCALQETGIDAVDRDRMRTMLSLTRLRFSAVEAEVRSFAELRALNDRYTEARRRAASAGSQAPAGSRTVRNWSQRHIHSLHSLLPLGIRATLERGLRHMPACRPMPVTTDDTGSGVRIERDQAVNELALAHCSLILLRRAARPR